MAQPARAFRIRGGMDFKKNSVERRLSIGPIGCEDDSSAK